MKLHQIVLFGSLVMLLGLGMQFVFPKDGLLLYNDTALVFPDLKSTYAANEDIAKKKQLAAIMAEEEEIEEETVVEEIDPEEQRRIDSLRAVQILDSIRTWQLKLHYPNDDKTILYSLFEALDNAKHQKRPLHILHYGDSQIEGDRMTGYIRHKLQSRFGGKGAGWLPSVPLVWSRAFGIEHSENWHKAHLYGLRDSTIHHKRFGPMAIMGRFCPYPSDSLVNDTLVHEAWITYKRKRKSFPATQSFRDFRMFYGYNTLPVTFKLYEEDSLMLTDTLAPGKQMNIFHHRFEHNVKKITLKFSGYDSPDVYGVALDGTNGVEVSNIAMRGNSGTTFTRIPRSQLTTAYKQFDIKLLLLQYGGNVMPFAVSEKGIKSYAHRFEKNIKYLKKLIPGVHIIVIGPSDMSKKEGTEWITYPFLPTVRDALKQAAFNGGALYWDTYEAMGGEGSMKEWVTAEKPLAIKDYTHFTPRGARKVGQWFYNALIKDYHEYEAQKEKNQ